MKLTHSHSFWPQKNIYDFWDSENKKTEAKSDISNIIIGSATLLPKSETNLSLMQKSMSEQMINGY
jgi:hypothetical protein